MKKSGIRYWFVQSFIMMAIISSLIFFVGLQVYLFYNSESPLTIKSTFWLFLYVLTVLLLTGAYFGLKGSYLIKGRLGDILLFVSTH
ncbi:hypothetical protein ABE29_14395 [Cytobacillus firmus]|nr:hypothetical protein [Cytobacillus firmus]MBG9551252.1 hypothetical protein [Cytobacillus firmus]MBG9557532.1 hypothetical protein [Cytobacillus firmus]MBG9575273.1 hypothetical protein [Cytobacillus firmus]SUV02472.1 Uncharacterised protein [Cytobacillus firmus]